MWSSAFDLALDMLRYLQLTLLVICSDIALPTTYDFIIISLLLFVLHCYCE
jgi:hypothetical protein